MIYEGLTYIFVLSMFGFISLFPMGSHKLELAKIESVKKLDEDKPSDAYLLGLCFQHGEKEISQDLPTAIWYLEKAAGLGNVQAQLDLGKMLCAGTLGCFRDIEKGRNFLVRASMQKNVQAQILLSCGNSTEIVKLEQQIQEFLEARSKQGDSEASLALGISAEFQARNIEQALSYYQQALQQGSLLASRELLRCFSYGKESILGYSRHHRFFENPELQCTLGDSCCSEGLYVEAVAWYTCAADLAEAKAKVGFYFLDGLGTECDYRRAFETFQSIAEENPLAQLGLGLCYNRGHGINIDLERGRELCNQAGGKLLALQDRNMSSLEQTIIGLCYQDGYGTRQDEQKSVELYQKAADKGFAIAQYNFGHCLYHGVGIPKDQSRAEALFLKAAGEGKLPVAQLMMGKLLDSIINDGHQKNDREALLWYKRAADQGYAEAQYRLGLCYYHARGTAKDLNKAFSEFSKAATQEQREAQYYLGWGYEHNQGVVEDLAQAKAWYKRAADQGYAEAQYRLGLFYYNGQGTTKDLSQAATLWMQAAQKGCAEAQFMTGKAWDPDIANGYDAKAKSYEKAIPWYQKAADQGHVEAQYFLGWAYEHGQEISQDRARAKIWYKKAVAQGHQDAQKRLTKLRAYTKIPPILKSRIEAAS